MSNQSNDDGKIEESDIIKILRLFVGIIGASLILDGFNLLTKSHLGYFLGLLSL